MTSRILHGVLTPPIPCCDPKCPICRTPAVAAEGGFSDPDDDEEDFGDDPDDWDEDEDEDWDDDDGIW